MLNQNLHREVITAGETPRCAAPPAPGHRLDQWLTPAQCLAPLDHVIAYRHRRSHPGGNQVAIRFHNGYGAIISEYRLLEGIYEIAPVRFLGPGPDDHEFYFRSHVPDLSWCSDPAEMLSLCEQISRLAPGGPV